MEFVYLITNSLSKPSCHQKCHSPPFLSRFLPQPTYPPPNSKPSDSQRHPSPNLAALSNPLPSPILRHHRRHRRRRRPRRRHAPPGREHPLPPPRSLRRRRRPRPHRPRRRIHPRPRLPDLHHRLPRSAAPPPLRIPEPPPIYSSARVFFGGLFHNVADPRRHLADAIQSLTNPIGNLIDKFLIALTIIRVLTRSDLEILTAGEVETIELLRSTGFSDSIVDRLFRPFFAGIFFDNELETTSRLFDFVFKCLALGHNTLPSNGIASIPGNWLPS